VSPSSSREGRNVNGSVTNSTRFETLFRFQVESLAVNDSFSTAVAVNSTEFESPHRDGRSLATSIISSLLPFPLNILSQFVLKRETATTDDFEQAFNDEGISEEEADARMASMVKPFVPAPLDALLGAVLPFESLERELSDESTAVIDGDGTSANGASKAALAMQQFQQSLRMVADSYKLNSS
jgi:hypothetical protein